MLYKQGLKVEVRSENKFGDEHSDEWIIITPKVFDGNFGTTKISPITPSNEWFHEMKSREMDFDRSILIEKWDGLYHNASKKATVLRKNKLLTFISKEHPIASS